MSKTRRGAKKGELKILPLAPSDEPIAPEQPAPKKAKISFDQWWLNIQNELGLKPQLKESVRKHFEVKGYLANGNFDEGLADFGFIKT